MRRQSQQQKPHSQAAMINERDLVAPQVLKIKKKIDSIDCRIRNLLVSEELAAQICQLKDLVKIGGVDISQEVAPVDQTLAIFRKIHKAIEERLAQFDELYTTIDCAMRLLELGPQDMSHVASIPQAVLSVEKLVIPEAEDESGICYGVASDFYISSNLPPMHKFFWELPPKLLSEPELIEMQSEHDLHEEEQLLLDNVSDVNCAGLAVVAEEHV